jgi:hypothetical protein
MRIVRALSTLPGSWNRARSALAQGPDRIGWRIEGSDGNQRDAEKSDPENQRHRQKAGWDSTGGSLPVNAARGVLDSGRALARAFSEGFSADPAGSRGDQKRFPKPASGFHNSSSL